MLVDGPAHLRKREGCRESPVSKIQGETDKPTLKVGNDQNEGGQPSTSNFSAFSLEKRKLMFS